MIFIIKGFWTIFFIFIVISTTFRPMCPSDFFRCLLNSGTYTGLQITSFIETTGVDCSDSVCHNRVQVLSIPVLLHACSQDWTCNLQMIFSLEASGTNTSNLTLCIPKLIILEMMFKGKMLMSSIKTKKTSSNSKI